MRELVNKYEKLGVKLWVEAGNLKFRAPKGTMTEERKRELKENKEAIIRFLVQMDQVSHDEEGRFAPFPLTDIQAAYMVGRTGEYGYGGVGCKVYLELTGHGIEGDKLNRAWKDVIMRHDMMHAVVMKNGMQKVLEEVSIPDIRIVEKESGLKTEDIRQELSHKQYEPESWPLYDLVLVHEEDKDVLCFSIDMMIADFTSITIVLNELEALYGGSKLQPMSEITFRDVILDQKKNSENTKHEKAEEYWKSRIASMPGAPALPIQDGNPETVVFEQMNCMLSYEDWSRIENYAKQNGLTPASIILTVYSDVIARWSAQDAFTLNVTMADRRNPRADVSGLVGDFTVVDLLEVRHDREKNFRERAGQIQEQLWEDLEHISFSGVSVMREIKREKDSEALFPVVFTSTLGYKAEPGREKKDGLILTYKISQTPQVWIDCQISEEKNGILMNWDVRRGVFPEGMIRDAFGAFEAEIRALSGNPERIDEYKYEITPETERVRKQVNDTKGELPEGLLQDEWLKMVNMQPQAPAVYAGEDTYSYLELFRYAASIKDALVEKGVKEGMTVAVDLEKGIWSIASALGILLAGGIYLPLDCSQPPERKREILQESGTIYGIAQGPSKLFQEDAFINTEELILTERELTSAYVNEVRRKETDPAYMIFTSGSTGRPKGVVISHRAAKNTIGDINERFHVTNKDKVLALAKLAFDLSIYDIFGLLSVGGAIVVPDAQYQKYPKHWADLIVKHGVTIWNSVPAQMQMLTMYMQSEQSHSYLPLELVMLSGDWIPVALPEAVYQIAENARVISLGGATEASIWSNYYPVLKGQKFTRSIPYGTPLRNQYFHVLDGDLEHCPDWVAGELFIGGVGLADGYQNNPQETDQRFILHPKTGERLYRTGDLGRYMPDGTIEFLGRVDSQVKIRGHRIEVQEVESKLEELDGIGKASVVVRKKNGTAIGLDAFVELERKDDIRRTLVEEEALRDAVIKAGDKGTENLDRNLFAKWTKTANRTAIYDIFTYLNSESVFVDDEMLSMDQIFEKLRVHSYYHQLIRRWIKALCQEGLIEYVREEDQYRCKNHEITETTAKDSWRQWWEIENQMHYGKKLVEYFQDSSSHLPQLVRGEVDALDLFFPKGDFTIAKAAYHDNLLSSSLNQVMIGAIRHILNEVERKGRKEPLHILEIGAGVGGASLDIIPALEGCNVTYLFSDVSQYFLNAARENFGNYDFVNYGLYDINQPYWEQGIRPSQFDLIICNNVLHNARSLPAVLQSFREILTEGGAFIIADTTGENYSLLTSMEFHAGLSEFDDFRKESNQVFVTRKQWETVLGDAGAALAAEYPAETDPLAEARQVVFVGQFITRTKELQKEDILDDLKGKVPEYMVPGTLEILDRMPLTSNGKIDRKTLETMILKEEVSGEGEGNELREGLETRIGEIWKKALNRKQMWRDENFYKAGGDSLLLAQIVSEMKEQLPEYQNWEWDQLMAMIIQNPTIAGIAQKAAEGQTKAEKTSEEEDAKGSLKVLKKVEDSKRAVILFHDGTGTLSPYDALVPYLEKESNASVIGVYVQDGAEYLRHQEENLLKELGEKYAKELFETGLSTFCLVGYCMGGLVAVETAKNLIQSGVDVEPVITIDTTPADSRIRNDILMERTFGMLVGADLSACGYFENEELLKKALLELLDRQETEITVEDLAGLSGEFEEIGKNSRKLLEKSDEERLRTICNHITRLHQDMSEYQYDKMKELYQVLRKSFAGMSLYGDEFFTGDVEALSCSDKSSNFLPVLETQNQAFWESVALGDLKRVTIEGNHISCMQEPLVRNIAAYILGHQEER